MRPIALALLCAALALTTPTVAAADVVSQSLETPPAEAPPALPEHRVAVWGDESCLLETVEALDLLREKAPEHYAVVDQYVGVIHCSDEGDGMFVGDSPPRYRVGSATRETGTIWYASTIAHDAFHSKQFNDHRAAAPFSRVPDAVYLGRNAEAEAIAFQTETLVLMEAPERMLEWVAVVLDTEYWVRGH